MNPLRKDLPKMAFLTACLLLSFSFYAQNPNRNYLGHEKTAAGVEITTSDGKYLFRYFTPEIIETAFVPSGQDYIKESHAVVLEPQTVNFTVSEGEEKILIDSEGLDIEVSKMPFQVTYFFEWRKSNFRKYRLFKGRGA